MILRNNWLFQDDACYAIMFHHTSWVKKERDSLFHVAIVCISLFLYLAAGIIEKFVAYLKTKIIFFIFIMNILCQDKT